MKRSNLARQLVASAALTLVVVACSDATEGQRNDAAAAEIDVLPPDESVATPTQDLATGVIDTPPREPSIAPNPRTPIPLRLHGRWGLTREACASERDDIEGLVAITGESISFHNSVARPDKIYSSAPSRIHAEFAFTTADGRSWTGPMIWSVEGRQLVRVDSEADSRLVYTRC